MSTAPRFVPHYTVADYSQWEGRWELWDGVAVAMSPSPLGPHAKLLARLVTALGQVVDAAKCDATVLVEIDWIVSNDTVVRPDVTIVCGQEPAGHVEKPPALVAEVLSEATRERDLVFKRDLYAEQGVPWYVIIDPDARTLRVLHQAGAGSGVFKESVYGAASESISLDLCAGCRLALDPAWLFR